MYMKDIALTIDFALSAGGAGWAATTGWPGGRRRLPCSVLRRWLWWRRMNTPMCGYDGLLWAHRGGLAWLHLAGRL